ncbi:hypothetical protein PMAC_002787 [Pneumocystis sp. 'macacae']|nr:hypothetical protein PMAC_002787 [Pneumocystis sp. 'macacae']
MWGKAEERVRVRGADQGIMRRCGKDRINGFFLHVKGEQEEGGERCAPGNEMSVCTK